MHCRSATLPEQYVPEIKEALSKAGQNWDDWKVTDNTCKPHPPVTGFLANVSHCYMPSRASSLLAALPDHPVHWQLGCLRSSCVLAASSATSSVTLCCASCITCYMLSHALDACARQ